MGVSTNSSDEPYTSVWYKFREAAVAISAMCIRVGNNGYQDDLGELGVSLQR